MLDPKLAKDTIAAIATPPGNGGVGIIRISGDQAGDGCRGSQDADHLNGLQVVQDCRYRECTSPGSQQVREVDLSDVFP